MIMGRHVLSSVVLALCIAFGIGWDYPVFVDETGWVDRVSARFRERVLDYGLGNFPVSDGVETVNATYYGIHLDGNISYTYGELTDVGNFTDERRFLSEDIDSEDAWIHVFFTICNFSITYDLSAELRDYGTVQGVANINMPFNQIDAYVNDQYLVENITLEASEHVVTAAHTDFSPDTDVIRAIARRARLRFGIDIFWDQFQKWLDDPLIPILRDIVTNEIPFPIGEAPMLSKSSA